MRHVITNNTEKEPIMANADTYGDQSKSNQYNANHSPFKTHRKQSETTTDNVNPSQDRRKALQHRK